MHTPLGGVQLSQSTEKTRLEALLKEWFERVFEDVSPNFFSAFGNGDLMCWSCIDHETQNIRWFTSPYAWNLCQRAVLSHALDFDFTRDFSTYRFREDQTWLEFHLVFGSSPCLKRFRRDIDLRSCALLGAFGSSKTVTLCVPALPDALSGVVIKTAAFEDGLLRENLALRQLPREIDFPSPLGISFGELNKGREENRETARLDFYRHQSLQSLVYGYNLSVLQGVEGVPPWLDGMLGSLVNNSLPKTSLREQASRLSERIEESRIDVELCSELMKILRRVSDMTPLAPSRTHGDLRPANVLAVPINGSFEDSCIQYAPCLIDWELSRSDGLGIIDFAHFVLDRLNLNRYDVAFILEEGALGSLVASMAEISMEGSRLPVDQVFLLYLATYVFDRAWGFGGFDRGSGYAKRLAGASCLVDKYASFL